MPIVIRHNGVLNSVAEGLDRGLSNYRQSRELALHEQRYKDAAELAARRVAQEEQDSALQRTALQQDIDTQAVNQKFTEEQRALQSQARGIDQEASAFLGEQDEMPEEQMMERAGKIAARMPSEHAARFLAQSRSVLRARVIDRGIQKQVERIGALAKPQADAEGNETPGVIDEQRAKGIAEMLQLYADTDGAEGMSPDEAEQAINAVVVEKANAQTQTAMWGKVQGELARKLALVSQDGSDIPDENLEEASSIMSLAAIEPPKDAAGRAAIKSAFIKALYGGGAAAKAASKSPVERAHERVMEEARAGFFTTKDDKGHGNIDVAKVRAREQELVQLYSSHRDVPFEATRSGSKALPAPAPGGSAPAPAEQAAPAKKRPMSRLESLRVKNLPAWASLVQDGAKVIATGDAKAWTKWLAANSISEERLSEADVAAFVREAQAIRARSKPKGAGEKKADEQARERRNPAAKL